MDSEGKFGNIRTAYGRYLNSDDWNEKISSPAARVPLQSSPFSLSTHFRLHMCIWHFSWLKCTVVVVVVVVIVVVICGVFVGFILWSMVLRSTVYSWILRYRNKPIPFCTYLTWGACIIVYSSNLVSGFFLLRHS